MSDVPPPPGDLPELESETPHEAVGLWHRYRSLPVGLQILAPLVVLAVVVGVIVWATSGSDGDVASTETTTASSDSGLEVVMRGLIVAGGLTDPGGPTTDVPASALESTSTPTTMPPATTVLPSTTTTTTTASAPATTAPAGPVGPTTSARPTTTPPPTTSAPGPTEPPDTPEPPETTEPPDTTEAPTTTVAASPALPSVAEFFAQWNEATTGTDVPAISAAEARELTGDYSGYYLLTLTASGSTLPPQVGLVGTATAPGSGQLDEVLLVWIPGSDEDSSVFYWDCFGVLVQAVSPGASPDEIADLASALGRAPDTPPFSGTADVSSGGVDYQAFTLPYTGEAGTLDVSAIEIS